jgi:site-specific DNA recombinase
MKAGIYARYSSENQRPESIEDQVASCRKLAVARAFTVDPANIFTDVAASGARSDRKGLAALIAAAKAKAFEAILVDDLSRLARDNLLMLSTIAELHFHGVKIISVADGLDTGDSEAKLGIQIRGIFNELQLEDLRKKTLRGQLGQKQRGFIVGEATYGYKSQPVGEVRMDKKGRPRPEGYKMLIEPAEAGVILRIFREFAEGKAESNIVCNLNKEGIPGSRHMTGRWSPATIYRILKNRKYIGIWTWNRTETRRDPRTGRRRQFPKPEVDWMVNHDESLRIIPQELWDRVQGRMQQVHKAWPGGKGKRGFQGQTGNRVAVYPQELLSGAMECGVCGAAVVKVSGKSGGYYGCLGAKKGACANNLLVRRTSAEKIILEAVREKLSTSENLSFVLKRVEAKVAEMSSEVPETIRLKETELQAEERRLVNFVEFIGEGRGSKALADALVLSERKADTLKADLAALRESRDEVFKAPPLPWIEERVAHLQEVLEKKTEKSALLLRHLLGKIRLEPVQPDIGRSYLKAVSKLQVLALYVKEPDPHYWRPGFTEPDIGSNALQWWRRRESNPCPETFGENLYMLVPGLFSRRPPPPGRGLR